MAIAEVILPAMGEGIVEATITRWLAIEGQQVSADHPLVEVATDKVDSEIPSPVEGRIIKLVYREGDIPKVGEVIALIETDKPLEAGILLSGAERVPLDSAGIPLPTVQVPEKIPVLHPGENKKLLISPLVRMLARQRGISQEELLQIKGTGKDGRVTREDISHYNRGTYHQAVNTDDNAAALSSNNHKAVHAGPDDEISEMDRMRRLIAGHMLHSKQVAPHVTVFAEADISALVAWRANYKDTFLRKEGARLTFTPLFIEAVVDALKAFPRINASVAGDNIILRRNINIGIATALPDGNLIVPVIKNADHDSLGSLARKVEDLAGRAREGLLLPAEIKEGTFTITNIGQYNNLTGTPIINQPESAILALGTITKKPWAVKSHGDYGIAVRDIIMLSLTFDHRIIDGALGGSFLSRVVKNLEQSDPERQV